MEREGSSQAKLTEVVDEVSHMALDMGGDLQLSFIFSSLAASFSFLCFFSCSIMENFDFDIHSCAALCQTLIFLNNELFDFFQNFHV